MKKIALLSGKLNLKKLEIFNKRIFSKKKLPQENKKSSQDNFGERAYHVMPEIGECHLAKALIQFEQERAKSLIVA